MPQSFDISNCKVTRQKQYNVGNEEILLEPMKLGCQATLQPVSANKLSKLN